MFYTQPGVLHFDFDLWMWPCFWQQDWQSQKTQNHKCISKKNNAYRVGPCIYQTIWYYYEALWKCPGVKFRWLIKKWLKGSVLSMRACGCEISLQDLINLKLLNHKLCYLDVLKRCLINFNGSFLNKSPK